MNALTPNNSFDLIHGIVQHANEEIATKIFSHLDPVDLASCCAVSKTWRKIGIDERLWKHLFPTLDVPLNMSIREYINHSAVKSEDKILKRIQTFLQKIQLHQSGEFKCTFPFNPECAIRVVFGYGDITFVDHNDLCIFVHRFPTNEETNFLSSNDTHHQPSAFEIGLVLISIKFPNLGDKTQIMEHIFRMHTREDSTATDLFAQINSLMGQRVAELKEDAKRERNLYLSHAAIVGGALLAGATVLTLSKLNKK